MVYNLKCFIGDCFDVYFFLWSNGAPHWEREKFLWEQEQLREWTHIQSKRNKDKHFVRSPQHDRRSHFVPKKVPKKVRFAKNLVHVCHGSNVSSSSIRFGDFIVEIDEIQSFSKLCFGSFSMDNEFEWFASSDPGSPPCSSHGLNGASLNCHSKPANSPERI